MATCAISGTLVDASETAIASAIIKIKLLAPVFNAGGSSIMPTEISTTSDATGNWTLSVSQGQTVVISIDYPPNALDSSRRVNYTATVPATPTASFSTIATLVNT